MKKLLLILALFLFPQLAFAQNNQRNPCYYLPGTVNCIPVDTTNGLPVTLSGSGATSSQIQGNVANGATDSGNPVKVGGVYNSTLPTLTNGQRGDAQLTTKGALRSAIVDTPDGSGAAVSQYGNSDGGSSTPSALLVSSYDRIYNGSTWDRQFTCPNSAVVNVTAASTTEIVSLTASQVIRVCSIAVSMSVAGTVTFVNGTGTNCGTGTTSLTGAMPLALGTPLSISGMNGSLLRTSASNALCVTAATGNVIGFITYAKF